MGAPKKPANKKIDPKNAGPKKPGLADSPKPQKKVIEDDDDFEEQLDDLDGYESFDDYDDDDDDYKY
ncbi:hypothetical protein EOD41_11140 [Mucilaginibacter limnophilus]|uniref:Uncharacterized protein n=1 Tax=Mucilaginibacter limnophilus TaxID=1932778 RepID=A0A437MSC1_9SPHI|nr:hypothetical protein [Mucilaginibacter limnophilus]RVU00550.1 hypothetical protein EOD41_11140 [Mucilaginibacter limnophilus]